MSTGGNSVCNQWRQLANCLSNESLLLCGITAEVLQELTEEALAIAFRTSRLSDTDCRLVVFAGPSGGGKSTLFNAIIGSNVAATSSVQRPTTISVSGGGNISPGKLPTEGILGSSTLPFHESSEHLPRGLAVLDGPDHDTTVLANRLLSWRLLRWADAVCFVTSEERYADGSFRELKQKLVQLDCPIIAVMNRIRGLNPQEAERSLEALLDDDNLTIQSAVVIAQASGDSRPDVSSLREAISKVRPLLPSHRRTNGALRRVSSNLITPLRGWLKRKSELSEALDALPENTSPFAPDESLGRIRTLEHENRFWLRYSPRGVLSSLGQWLRSPVLFPRKDASTQPLDTDRVAATLVRKTEGILDESHVRVVEALKIDEIGRWLLASESWDDAPCSPDQLIAQHQALIDDMVAFAGTQLEQLRARALAKRGILGKLQRVAIDLLLRTTVLALTLCVIPPLLTELLRIMGHPAFTSAFQSALKEWQETFQRDVQTLLAKQQQHYQTLLAGFGPTAELLKEIDVAMASIQDTTEDHSS